MKINDLPEPVRSRLRGFDTDGRNLRTESCSDVYLFTHRLGRRPGLILKTRDVRVRPQEPDLLAETVALTWLREKLPVPECRCFQVDGDKQYLLMTLMEGVTGIHPEALEDPEQLIREFAEGLQAVHALDIASCPLDWRKSRFISWAGGLIESGALDVSEAFDEDIPEGKTRTFLFEKLSDIKEAVPGEEDLVFTHGDYCLPNVMFKEGRLSSYIDLGYAGVGDRYLDLVAARGTIRRNLGEEWIVPFFHAYGLEVPDPAKLHAYQKVHDWGDW